MLLAHRTKDGLPSTRLLSGNTLRSRMRLEPPPLVGFAMALTLVGCSVGVTQRAILARETQALLDSDIASLDRASPCESITLENVLDDAPPPSEGLVALRGTWRMADTECTAKLCGYSGARGALGICKPACCNQCEGSFKLVTARGTSITLLSESGARLGWSGYDCNIPTVAKATTARVIIVGTVGVGPNDGLPEVRSTRVCVEGRAP
jgi:hypothetical protein